MVDYLHHELNGPAGDHVVAGGFAPATDRSGPGGRQGRAHTRAGIRAVMQLKGDVSLLRTLHRFGLRHVGLRCTNAGRNALARSTTATQVWNGPEMRVHDSHIDGDRRPHAGRARGLVGEMNRLGMLVDVTHMEAATFCLTIPTRSGHLLLSFATHEATVSGIPYLRSMSGPPPIGSRSRSMGTSSPRANSVYRTVVGTVLTVLFTMIADLSAGQEEPARAHRVDRRLLITMFFSGGLIPLYRAHIDSSTPAGRSSFPPSPSVSSSSCDFFMTVDTSSKRRRSWMARTISRSSSASSCRCRSRSVATIALWHAVWHWNEWLYALRGQ